DERRPAGRPERARPVDCCTQPEKRRFVVEDHEPRALRARHEQMDGSRAEVDRRSDRAGHGTRVRSGRPATSPGGHAGPSLVVAEGRRRVAGFAAAGFAAAGFAAAGLAAAGLAAAGLAAAALAGVAFVAAVLAFVAAVLAGVDRLRVVVRLLLVVDRLAVVR